MNRKSDKSHNIIGEKHLNSKKMKTKIMYGKAIIYATGWQ